MPQLRGKKFTKLELITLGVAILVLSYVLYYKFSGSSRVVMTIQSQSLYAWGKGQGPIQVKILEQEMSGETVTLEGQIQTTLPNIDIEWRLPEGATLVNGQQTEHLDSPGTQVITRTIVVRKGAKLSRPHVVLFVHNDDKEERYGNSAVYNLNTSPDQQEKVMKIQKMMQDRGSKPMR